MSDQSVEFLKKVSAFAGVSDEGLKRLAKICRPFEMNAGDVIIREGEEGDCVYIIETGQVEVSMAITMASGFLDEAENLDKILVKLGPGHMFGEMAFLFDRDVRSATITALSEGKLLRVGSEDFRKFTEDDLASAHRILLNIAQTIAARLRKTNMDVKKLTTALSIAMRKPRRM